MSAGGHESLSARAAAHEAVSAVLRREGFVSEVLAGLRQAGRLAPRETGLATETALGTVRHLLTIETVLRSVATYEPHNVAPELRAVLCTAAYQALWLDRVPLFAAVNEAVALAHERVSHRAAGMVNAVLRRLTGAIETRVTAWQPGAPHQVRTGWAQACALRQPVFPPADPDLEAYVAAAAGERPARLRTLVERLGWEAALQVAWASQAVPPLVVQRNRGRVDAAAFTAAVRAAFGADVLCDGDTAYLTPGTALVDAELFQAGLCYVQDSTAQAAALLVGAQPGERVLDLCAAPGGKTALLAAAVGARGEVVACDVAPQRLIQVSANADRLGLACVRTHLLSADGPTGVEGRFDAAIADVPCSNTGVLARRPEARLGLTAQKVASLADLQRGLIRQAAACVRPGGRLVYSTCCLEPEENERVVDDFLFDQPAWRLVEARTTLPAWGATAAEWRDGGFAALLEQRG